MINIGLNISNNEKKYDIFQTKIQESLQSFPNLNYINVSNQILLTNKIHDLDILLTYNINEQIFNLAKSNLKWIHFGSAGIEDSLSKSILSSKTILTNSSGIHANPVSEFVMGCILYHCKRFNECSDFKKNMEWNQWPIAKKMIQLKNQTIGIIGYGAIGKKIAQKAKQFNMRVIATRRLQKQEISNKNVDRLLPLINIKELYKESDFIVIACPLTPKTENLISSKEIKIMKKNTFIINIARGKIINDAALVKALKNQDIAGAALDVFSQEPLPQNHPYFSIKNIFLSPHVSGNFPEYQSDMVTQFINNVTRFLKNKPLKNRICKKRLY